MYKSPIELFMTEIRDQILKQHDEEVYKAVLRYVPNVDKKELIRALNYDRNQYNQGYDDGRKDAIANIVHCKECRYYKQNPHNRKEDDMWCQYWFCWNKTEADDFCSYGQTAERNCDIETNCFDF